MLKQTLALIGLTLSLGANAVTIEWTIGGTDDYSGSFTFDTVTSTYSDIQINSLFSGATFTISNTNDPTVFNSEYTGALYKGGYGESSLLMYGMDASFPVVQSGVTLIEDGYVYGDLDIYQIFDIVTLTPSAVPIPAAAWLFGSALLGLGLVKRKNTQSKEAS